MRRLRNTDGATVVIALMAMMVMTALATALMLTTMTETRIAASYGVAIETFYAADAAVERAIDDVRTLRDWSTVVAGGALSAFVDGAPGGSRTLSDGTTLDLGEETAMVRAGESPAWRLFAYGALPGLLPAGRLTSRAYIAVWIADAPFPSDGEALALLGQAYGPQGARRSVQVVLTRKDVDDPKGIVVRSWREGP